VAVGGREDDFEASGADFHRRGAEFDRMLDRWAEVWSGDEIGPEPPGGRPGLLIGGSADVAFERAARHADGWIMGGGAPDQFREGAAKLDAAWRAAGRDGSPRTAALSYFALGDAAREAAEAYLGDYYAFLGDYAQNVASSAATDEDTVRAYVDGFAAAGCDELILFPCSTDPGQVDLLAGAVL
jgi:alkanesulfonate monooxygenase SsuD/methylene tetrahydromethanopterin reductase-like flavin-dependent oxidoreductase (luciferase family)